MKRLTYRQRKYTLRRRAKIQERASQSKRKRRTARRARHAEFIQRKGDPSTVLMTAKPQTRLQLPEVLSLTDAYDETVAFFERFRRVAFYRRRRVHVDFTTLHHANPGAALMLAAELDRWRRLYNFRVRVVDIEKWDPIVRRQFYEMGLFDLLKVSNPPDMTDYSGASSDGQRLLKFRSHHSVLGEQAVELRKALEDIAGTVLQRKFLFKGLTEGMTNVLKHAYPSWHRFETPILPDRWWMSGAYNASGNRLTVMFIDQGVGIPATLPRKYALEMIRGFFARLGIIDDDASRIRAAMELGATQTGLPQHGKGLPNLQEFVDNAENGRLRILSGKGEYIYEKGQSPTLLTHRHPLGGTLIQWDIQL